MLLPRNPNDLLPFFWRVPAHTKRRSNASKTIFEFAPIGEKDRSLPNTISKAIARGSKPTPKNIESIFQHLSRNDSSRRDEFEQARKDNNAALEMIAQAPLPATTWPTHLEGLSISLGLGGRTPPEVEALFSRVLDYADRAERLRRALFAEDIKTIGAEVANLPFTETGTLDFVQGRLAGLNDPITAGHLLGLLFPLTMMELIASVAAHSDDDMFRFLPRHGQKAGSIDRPMRLFMGAVQTVLDLPTKELTNRALLSDDLRRTKEARDEWVETSQATEGWSYWAPTAANSKVPSRDRLCDMIERASARFPEKSEELKGLKDSFWQVCLFENLLLLCEELSEHVPDIDPLLPFQYVSSLPSWH